MSQDETVSRSGVQTRDNSPNKSTGETVTVACKKPGGHILQLCRPISTEEPILGGGTRKREEWRPYGEQVRLNNPVLPFGVIPPYRVVAGYALTEGVDKGFFQEWMKQHAADPIVINGLLFAHRTVDGAAEMAKERRAQRTGLERLDIEKNDKGVMRDPRVPKPRPGEIMLETADRSDREAA